MQNRLGRWAILLLIVLAAFGFRVTLLESVPPGLTHDESAHVHDALRIWQGERPIYWATAYGREPWYDYATAPLVALLGLRVFSGRLASAFWGTLLVALVYSWARRAFGRVVGVLAAAAMAVSFWPVATSRQILRSITMPVLLTLALILFWRGVYPNDGRHRLRYLLGAGIVLGLSVYTYMPGRVTWLIPLFGGLFLVLVDRARWRQVRCGLGWMLLFTVLVAGPLASHLARHPELEVRLVELSEPIRSLLGGDPVPLWIRLRESALLFSHQGDTQWIYNLAGLPLLPPALAVLLYVGVLVALWRALVKREMAAALLLVWFGLGAAPALLTGLESSSLRAIAAQPAVYVLIALPVAALWQAAGDRWVHCSGSGGRIAPSLIAGLALVGLVALAGGTAKAYFDLWASHPDTRVAYHSHIVTMSRWIQAGHYAPAGVSTIYPGPLHDPSIADVVIQDTALKSAIRWYDGRQALVFPAADRAWALFSQIAPLDPALEYLFARFARFETRVNLDAADHVGWFDVYSWRPAEARQALDLNQALDLGYQGPAGRLVSLVGFDLLTPEVIPGGTVELVTFWKPVGGDGVLDELVLFTHLLDAGRVVAQEDRLGVPVSSWQAGDLFAQLHRFSVPPDLPAGVYPLECGAYWRVEGYPRLIVYDRGIAAGDRIILSSLEVISSPTP